MTWHPASKEKILYRGDSKRYRFTLREKQTDPATEPARINLTGALVTFTMKLIPGLNKSNPEGQRPGLQPTTPVSVVKTSDDTSEVEIEDQLDPDTEGQAIIILTTHDTRFLPPGVYAYDVQVETAQGEVITAAAEGRILLRASATEAEDLTTP